MRNQATITFVCAVVLLNTVVACPGRLGIDRAAADLANHAQLPLSHALYCGCVPQGPELIGPKSSCHPDSLVSVVPLVDWRQAASVNTPRPPAHSQSLRSQHVLLQI